MTDRIRAIHAEGERTGQDEEDIGQEWQVGSRDGQFD